jgi:hypothetical protein
LRRVKELREVELLEKDRDYNSLQEEVENQRVIIMHLRKRYK